MGNRPLQTEVLSDRSSDHYQLVREARHPQSPGGRQITDDEAEEIEQSAHGVARAGDDVRLIGRMCQQLWHRGPHEAFEARVERDIADSRRMPDLAPLPKPYAKARYYLHIVGGRKSNRR